MQLTKLVFFSALLITLGSTVAHADQLIISGSVNIAPTSLDFTPFAGGNGSFNVVSGDGIFGPIISGSTGTIADLQFQVNAPLNQSFSLSPFATFMLNPSQRLDLTFIHLGGFGSAGCTASPPASGQGCTPNFPALITPANPQGISPFNLANNSATSSTLSFSVQGNYVSGATSTPFNGVFSMTFTNLNFQQMLSTWNSGGLVTGTYSAFFTATPASVPEPMTIVLLGTGLAGVVMNVRRHGKLKR